MSEEAQEKKNIVTQTKALFKEMKTHWKEPAPGRYVPYKEYINIVFGVGSNYAASKTLEYISFATGCYLIMYHYNLPYLAFSVITLINTPLQYMWNLIGWFINDNLGFMPKKTTHKLYAFYIAMAVLGSSMILLDYSQLFNQSSSFIITLNNLEGVNAMSVFKILGTHIMWNGWSGCRNMFYRHKLIPKYGRYKYCLYCDALPKCIMVILIGWLPIYNITDVTTRVWIANLLFSAYNMFGFANQLETCTQNISPNLRERILVRSYPIKLSHIFQSILAMIIPAIIATLDDSWADINVFRWVIPGIFIAFVTITMLQVGKIQERIPQPPLEKKVNIDFWYGTFSVLHNKYRWINTIIGLLDSLGNGMLAFTTILYLYTLRLDGIAYSLIVALISFCGTPPDLLSPYFLRRFNYKQIMIFYQLSRAIAYSLVCVTMWFSGDNVQLCGIICVIILGFLEMTKTVPTTAGHDMDVRISDYQMYLSGERLESFSGVFGMFTTPITTLVGLIIPIILLRFGFNSNWDAYFIDSARAKIVIVPILFDVAGYILMTIPYFFWDYNNEKQNQVMGVLRKRAEVTARQAAEHGESVAGGFKG